MIFFPSDQSVYLHIGDCLKLLKKLPLQSHYCCVTSPPYWGLRDYQVDGQIGLEPNPEDYIDKLVTIFREVRRVLRPDGTLWLNLGDSYAGTGSGFRPGAGRADGIVDQRGQRNRNGNGCPPGFKPKDLMMIPSRVALALQADGWWLRSAIVWHRPNAIPESVKDRPTSAYEMVYLFAVDGQYYYDSDAIRETAHGAETRNARNVWSINTKPIKGSHFATMAPELATRCILAGCPENGMVLDPFGGSGTTGLVAAELGRKATLIELNESYAEIIRERLGAFLA